MWAEYSVMKYRSRWHISTVHGRVNHGSSNFLLCAVLRYVIRGHAVNCHFVYSLKCYSHLYLLKRILAHILTLIFHLTIWFLCGNKMPTRCNRWYLLRILLLAQHASGTTMPIVRSSRVLYRWLLPVVFGALVFKL